SHAYNSLAGRVIDGLDQRVGDVGQLEAHIDDVGAVVGGVVDRPDDVRDVGGAISLECLERHDLSRGRNQVDQPGYHRSVAEIARQRPALQDRCGRLLEDSRSGLVELHDVERLQEWRPSTAIEWRHWTG